MNLYFADMKTLIKVANISAGIIDADMPTHSWFVIPLNLRSVEVVFPSPVDNFAEKEQPALLFGQK